jgi:hypothetical protein
VPYVSHSCIFSLKDGKLSQSWSEVSRIPVILISSLVPQDTIVAISESGDDKVHVANLRSGFSEEDFDIDPAAVCDITGNIVAGPCFVILFVDCCSDNDVSSCSSLPTL